VVSALNQFGLASDQAEKVSNVFASAISNSQATMEKLGMSMQYVGPLFNSLDKPIEEATAALMALYNAGYEASMAGTALRMGLAQLLDPTKETKKAIEKLGLSVEELNPATHSLGRTD